MTWFKVDDGFADHPKVLALQSASPKHWKGAIALWTLAGSWCSRHLTDGKVPDGVVLRLGSTPAEAGALVLAGLWTRTEDGYQFHDWLDRNPSRDRVEEKRDAQRKRVTKHREKRAGNASCNALQNAPVTDAVTPPPSRPVPSLSTREGARDQGRPDSAFVSALVNGVREAYESERLAPPRQTRHLLWDGWHHIASWCETQARLENAEPLRVAQTLVGRFLAAESRKQRGYPLPYLAANPAEYWRAA